MAEEGAGKIANAAGAGGPASPMKKGIPGADLVTDPKKRKKTLWACLACMGCCAVPFIIGLVLGIAVITSLCQKYDTYKRWAWLKEPIKIAASAAAGVAGTVVGGPVGGGAAAVSTYAALTVADVKLLKDNETFFKKTCKGSSSGISAVNYVAGNGSSGTIAVNDSGRVKPEDLRAYLEKRISGSKLNGYMPSDGARYGVDGSAASWAQFMTRLVGVESGYNTNDVSEPWAFEGGSRGLFQLSFNDALGYGLNGGKPFSAEQLADPVQNADIAVTIMERLVLGSGRIRQGGGRDYWGPIRDGRI